MKLSSFSVTWSIVRRGEVGGNIFSETETGGGGGG